MLKSQRHGKSTIDLEPDAPIVVHLLAATGRIIDLWTQHDSIQHRRCPGAAPFGLACEESRYAPLFIDNDSDEIVSLAPKDLPRSLRIAIQRVDVLSGILVIAKEEDRHQPLMASGKLVGFGHHAGHDFPKQPFSRGERERGRILRVTTNFAFVWMEADACEPVETLPRIEMGGFEIRDQVIARRLACWRSLLKKQMTVIAFFRGIVFEPSFERLPRRLT
ncbi:hypothetical protein [Bradyrhizobium sp. Ai1a-2]|uniref:hypothetical protein n=1 Tax=Bradyrhizobium sp. Ai1a-2 TaxID=196490 RepID=UPI00126980AB|nr:hypothetical protein [Bradyrhizobium sp. Ai1a-2]